MTWTLADFVAPVTTKLPGTPRGAFGAAHAELRQLICKGFDEGITREKLAEAAARCERDADCGNYPRFAIPRATVRSIGTGWRLVQAQRAMR